MSTSTSALSTETSAAGYPACSSGLRLRAVQFDPNHRERSFVVFAGSSLRAPPLRQGARVGSYAIERIERGAAVLSTSSERCSLRLRSAPLEHELRAVSVEAVRSGLRSATAARTLASANAASVPSTSAHEPRPSVTARAAVGGERQLLASRVSAAKGSRQTP